ncbi:energy-coupling factor transporter transmembrane component T [Fusobacterium sp. HC1336]|uniref:energy-coupling factor transporter transmembrane component T n=1 Tax=Fusobacterium sp. HC1336 TaxID=3171169 RepID=UPI003F1ED42C
MNNIISNLYPSTKFRFLLLMILIVMFSKGYELQYSIFLLAAFLSFASGKLKEMLSSFFKCIFLVVIFIFLVQVFIVPNEDSQHIIGFIHFSNMGLSNSLLITSKIVGISSMIIYFFQTTSIKDIIYAMEKANISKKVVFVIAATIQMIPQMKIISKNINDAQKSRGIETEGGYLTRLKAFIPMIGPLVLLSIQQIEERVLALETRGFSCTEKKTTLYLLEKNRSSKIIDLVVIIFLVVFFILGVM